MVDKHPCATARDKFEKENRDLFEGEVNGQYLRNRLLKTYEQGWWDRDNIDEGSLSRDELAARAMQGLLGITAQGGWTESWSELAQQAYNIADSMVEARQ